MFIERLSIEGYKSFGERFTIPFHKGLNVLVGENAVGKSAVIDALRALLLDDDFERKPISDTDFHLPFAGGGKRAPSFKMECSFAGMSQDQQVAFLPWTDLDGKAKLTLEVDNKQNSKGRYKRNLWGGASRASMFERELFDAVDCIYLPPLRDAEAKLREGRSSRLARLLRSLNRQALQEAKDKGQEHALVQQVKELNEKLCSDKNEHVKVANELIRDRLLEAIGEVFAQDTQIKFTEADFGRIAESLRLFFFPERNSGNDASVFRSLEENSLGYNNLLYIATVLAELKEAPHEITFKALLIEEPEAHLHPQFQTRLLQFLAKAAEEDHVQVIVTTHSPVLAAAAPIDSLIHLSRQKENGGYKYVAVPLAACGLGDDSKRFLRRWLDVTKSTLLFAKGIILVEGIAEAMLMSELARRVLKEYNEKRASGKAKLPECLEDAGVTVVNMNGIYFEHFLPLFCNLNGAHGENISVYCSGVTDKDPDKESEPVPSDRLKGHNPALGLVPEVNRSSWARLYRSPLKTLEYDLAFEADSNRKVMTEVLRKLWPSETEGSVRRGLTDMGSRQTTDSRERAQIASRMLKWIDNRSIGKGLFAQSLADKLRDRQIAFLVPKYIREAIVWACGGDPRDA